MQTGRRKAVPPGQGQSSDDLTTGDSGTGGDGDQDRLVGRAQPPVVNDHHAPSRHLAGEAHPACRHGEHRLTHGAGEIDAAVPRSPRVERRLERSDDLRPRLERPVPALEWLAGEQPSGGRRHFR